MNITPPSDDSRLRALNRAKLQSGELQPVKELEEPARPAPIDEDHEHQARSPEDQRRGQRRRQERKALLDTRAGRERRKQPRRQEELEQEKTASKANPQRGIDVTA